MAISVFSNGIKDSIREKSKWQLDSNYVVSYPDRLIVSLYQSWRFYDLLFTQTMMPDSLGQSSMNYIARGNNSSGIGFSWDKIAFSLGRSIEATESDISRKGITKTSNLSFSVNSKRYRLEAAYRKYVGFYDQYTPRRDTAFSLDSTYHQLSGMYAKAFRLKGFYFSNKKQRYSYGAAFNNSARQLKTAGSFLLVSNLYGFSIGSDTSIISPGAGSFYPQWENWNSFKTLGLSINGGYTFNLVIFKRFFANLTGTLGLELQNFKYSTSDGISAEDEWKFGWSAGDLRGSLGYNGEKFFAILSYIGDFSVYRLKNIELNTRLHYGSFTFGYRFRMKENKITSWLKNNKIYKML
jgi:hypothetical protein